MNNFINLRKAHAFINVIPFFGLYLTDLKINEERVEEMVESNNSTNMIEWWRHSIAAKVLKPLSNNKINSKPTFPIKEDLYKFLYAVSLKDNSF